MKKNITYSIIVIAFVAAIALTISSYKNKITAEENTSYNLLNRTGPSSQTAEWETVKLKSIKLAATLQEKPNDTKTLLAMAGLFIQEARSTGNYGYYDKAALNYVNKVLGQDSTNFDALTLKSLLYLSQHHFADGLAIARKANTINPYNAFVYGLATDGNVETGNYDSAVATAQRMVDLRPDIRSYSRVSYLREIYGDYPGAIDAMDQAVNAGAPGDESTEWARIQLGHLYENTGDLKSAELQYSIALERRTDYPYAIAGLARLAAAGKDYQKAIDLYIKADRLISDMAIKEALADVYVLNGDKQKAEEIMKEVIEGLSATAESGNKDENIGHYADKELAYAFIKTGNYDKALEHAILEYNRRPLNIDVNEAVAWVYYCRSDYTKALPYIKTALKTGSKNPTLLCYAGLIYVKTGDKINAKTMLSLALSSNPNIAEDLKQQSLSVLKTL